MSCDRKPIEKLHQSAMFIAARSVLTAKLPRSGMDRQPGRSADILVQPAKRAALVLF